ncbi:MAG: type II toxin-antitoxin system HicA family toxin [Acidobacteriota bacterium]|nr:type II toxin-antitoxin system HicA family toxin [Acidobacteriota bacterium]
MTAKDLRRILRSFGCVERRQRGSHLRVECGRCVTTVPVHAGEESDPVCCVASSATWSRASGKAG